MNYSRSLKTFFATLAMTMLSAGALAQPAAAATPVIPYQGHLTDAAGLDIDADLPIEVRLYDSAIAGIGDGVTNPHVLYAEQHPGVHVAGGLFRIAIGEGTALNAQWTGLPVDLLATKENVYLELWIDGERLTLRQRIGSFPAALNVARAKYADAVKTKPTITPEMVPAYDASKITAGTFLPNQVPSLSAANFTTGNLASSKLPALNISKFDTSSGKPLIDPARVPSGLNAGAMTGASVAPGVLPAQLLEDGEIAFGSGALGHHQMLMLPTGFETNQCWIAFTPAVLKESIPFGIEYLNASFTNGTDHVLSCEYYQDAGTRSNCTGTYLYACMK